MTHLQIYEELKALLMISKIIVKELTGLFEEHLILLLIVLFTKKPTLKAGNFLRQNL